MGHPSMTVVPPHNNDVAKTFEAKKNEDAGTTLLQQVQQQNEAKVSMQAGGQVAFGQNSNQEPSNQQLLSHQNPVPDKIITTSEPNAQNNNNHNAAAVNKEELKSEDSINLA